MPTNYPFPRPEAIRRVIADLLGREVTVVKGDALTIEGDTPAVVADYANDEGALAALCITDLRLSNALGAALTMVAASTVDEAVRKSEIEQSNIDNLAEIVNVMARLFNHDDCAHLRWSGAHKLPGELPAPASELMQAPSARRDYDVTVEEYGAGKLAIVVA